MANRYFENLNPANPIKALLETDRTFDIRDEKWAHPALSGNWDLSAVSTAILYDPNTSVEVKRKTVETIVGNILALKGKGEAESPCDITSYMVPGCPEEPETEVEVLVYRPKNLKKKKARVLYYCLGGALVLREAAMYPIAELCVRFNCVAVVTLYRRSWEAPYPAAINDMHAGYQWMVENAEMLQINPNNVVITGVSSGSHLATCLPFRLKRYGYTTPKGVVAIVPQTDDREKGTLANRIYDGGWSASDQRFALAQYLGNNFASSHIGPEALANHATVEECIGYPPTFIHTVEFDPDRDYCREFYGKLLEAKTYAEFHTWGGANHTSEIWNGAAKGGELNEYSQRVKVIFDGNIEDCFKYDLRRPWVLEENK